MEISRTKFIQHSRSIGLKVPSSSGPHFMEQSFSKDHLLSITWWKKDSDLLVQWHDGFKRIDVDQFLSMTKESITNVLYEINTSKKEYNQLMVRAATLKKQTRRKVKALLP